MEGLYVQPLEEDGVVMGEESEENGEQDEGGMKASSPTGSTAEEDTDEDSEPEPPQVNRRKVSFADAFGFNLVSVKEFDNAEVTESEVSQPSESKTTHPSEEFYMSCLFTVPSSPEELDQRLQAQMVELESIELLPGTTTLRGIIRVVNLCYRKSVYVRISLDRWTSYFDLLAEYVPGSSDRKTDRFTFKYTLVPPFEKDGTRVEVCLRYETSVGTFWANNKEINYVLFCHKKGQIKEHGPLVQEESAGYKSKRSCLKANRRGSAEETTWETSNPSAAAAEAEATHKAEEANRKNSTDIQSLLYHEEHKPLVDSIKSRHRAARLARVHDFLSQRRQQVPKAHDPADGRKISQPLTTPWGKSASFIHKCQKKQSNESPRVLTYHQIPLLTLDWNNDKTQQWGAAEMDDIWTGGAKMTLSNASEENIEDTPSINDMWGTFRNGTDDTSDKETSVCDVWQAFLNGPSCTDHSGVPESEWLQTAASVSPSNDKDPNAQYATSSQEPDFQVGTDTPTTLHAHASDLCQLLSDTCEISLANVALNTEDHQTAEGCVSSPRDDNTATQDASQRSQANSVTDTRQEFCLKGATPVSEGSADSSSECHKHAIREREREGIIGRAEGIGKDGPFTPHTADLVTSSGESETTDMTAMPESQNASAVDRISQGARLHEGLSSSRDGEVTGTVHNVMDDTLAFRGTIREGTKDGERFVFSTSRQGVEEGITNDCTGNTVPTDEEIFRPQKTGECEISQRYADETQHEEFSLNQNSENPLQENESDENEIRLAQINTDESNLSQTSEENFKQRQIMEKSESEDVASNKYLEEEEPSFCTTSGETKRLIGAEIIQALDDVKLNSSWQKGHTSILSEVNHKQSGPIRAGESESGEHVLVSKQTEEGKSCDGIIEQQQEINPLQETSHAVESREMKKVFQGDIFRPFLADKCNPNPVEVVEMRLTHSQDDTKGQKEDVAKKDAITELQRQPETLERTEEDMSQRDRDERVSIGKLEIEELGEMMGNVENPHGESRNAPAELKELSAEEEESSPRVEYQKLSEGTKDPITAENTAALEEIESRMFIERFGEDVVRGIWEEVFGQKVQTSNRDTDDEMGGELADITQDYLFEKDFNDAFDSGVFSLTDLPTDACVCQGLALTVAVKSHEYSRLATAEPILSESHTDLNSSAHLSQQDLTPIAAAQSRQSLTVSAQSSPQDQENYTQIQERSVIRHETSRQREDCVVAHRESFNRSPHKYPKLKESDSVVWLMLYILSHIIRLLICILLVAGFFFILSLYDFPALFWLYIFSLCWWFYKWKRHRVMTNKEIKG